KFRQQALETLDQRLVRLLPARDATLDLAFAAAELPCLANQVGETPEVRDARLQRAAEAVRVHGIEVAPVARLRAALEQAQLQHLPRVRAHARPAHAQRRRDLVERLRLSAQQQQSEDAAHNARRPVRLE